MSKYSPYISSRGRMKWSLMPSTIGCPGPRLPLYCQAVLICTLRPSTNCSSNILAIDSCHSGINTKLKIIKSKPQSSRIIGDPAVNALKYTWPALKLAPTVLEKILNGVPIPGLQGVIAGFLKVAKTVDVSCASGSTCTVVDHLSRRRSRTRRMSLSSRTMSQSSLAFSSGGPEYMSSLRSLKSG